jgi:hypothetical protein
MAEKVELGHGQVATPSYSCLTNNTLNIHLVSIQILKEES